MNNVTVIGCGTMGNGISHVFAQHKYKTVLVDISEKAVENALRIIEKNLNRQVEKGIINASEKQATLQRITTNTSIKEGIKNADLIIEAVTEDLDIKKNIFKILDQNAPKESILATNTSSISITKIASYTSKPNKVIGMHFMNPVPIMKLIEVIRGYATSDETTKTIIEISKKLNKIPVEVHDYPGFISNRILMPMINESIITLYENVAGVLEIDNVMRLGMSHPMGPLQLADFIGLDVCLSIMNVLYENLRNSKYAPCPLLINMVNAGYLGYKTGEGFYKYKKDTKKLEVSSRFQ